MTNTKTPRKMRQTASIVKPQFQPLL